MGLGCRYLYRQAIPRSQGNLCDFSHLLRVSRHHDIGPKPLTTQYQDVGNEQDLPSCSVILGLSPVGEANSRADASRDPSGDPPLQGTGRRRARTTGSTMPTSGIRFDPFLYAGKFSSPRRPCAFIRNDTWGSVKLLSRAGPLRRGGHRPVRLDRLLEAPGSEVGSLTVYRYEEPL